MRKGTRHSPDSLRRMSEVRKGHRFSPETKLILAERASARSVRVFENETIRLCLETFLDSEADEADLIIPGRDGYVIVGKP